MLLRYVMSCHIVIVVTLSLVQSATTAISCTAGVISQSNLSFSRPSAAAWVLYPSVLLSQCLVFDDEACQHLPRYSTGMLEQDDKKLSN